MSILRKIIIESMSDTIFNHTQEGAERKRKVAIKAKNEDDIHYWNEFIKAHKKAVRIEP